METKKAMKKTIKKITALGMGATLVGATLLGAGATNLDKYPDMFIKDGHFDALLVIGEEAKSIDTIGMTNIAMGLQAEAVTKTEVCEGVDEDEEGLTVDEGVLIETSNQKLYHWLSLNEIKPVLDDSDLPYVLEDGNYRDNVGPTSNDEDYTQRIELMAGGEYPGDFPRGVTNMLTFAQDDDYAEYAGFYLVMGDRTPAYKYVLEFDNPIEFEAGDAREDFMGNTIKIQGETYTITDVKVSNDKIDRIELLVGDEVHWLETDGRVTTTHEGVEREIELVDITDADRPACGLSIDGSMHWLDQGDTVTVDGLTIGVSDAKALKQAGTGMCKVNFGAEKMLLSHGDEVELDGEDVDGSKVYLHSRGSEGTLEQEEWSGLVITWTPDDNTYLPFVGEKEDRQLVDPVFGNFKYVAAGIDEEREDIEFSVGSRSGSIEFVNSDGELVELDLSKEDEDVFLGDGDDIDDQIYFMSTTGEGNNTCSFSYTGDVANRIDDCEGARWLLSASGEAHVVELTSIDWDSSDERYEVDVRDHTYDRRDTGNRITLDDGMTGTGTFYVSGLGNVEMNVTSENGVGNVSFNTAYAVDNHDGSNNNPLQTEYGMVLKELYYDTDNNRKLVMTWEEEDASESDGNRANVTTTVHVDDDKLKLDKSVDHFSAPLDYSKDNDDDQVYASGRGTIVVFDTDDDQELSISYPASDIYGSVYISPEDATVRDAREGEVCYTTEKVNPIPSTANKFDTEVSGVSYGVVPQNLITIGGPCANMVTAALMGDPEDCMEGFEEGMALLRFVEDGENIALIVAGAKGEDTRIASQVLQNYREYKDELVGKELEVVTVEESDIDFRPVEE